MDLKRELTILEQAKLVEALEEISLGNGAYNMDPFTHARNCIENMKSIATKTLNSIKP